MHYAISVLPAIPLRSAPSEKEEMLTQLVFGEHVKIVEKKEKWSFVETDFDSYHGWVDNTMIHPLSEELLTELKNTETKVTGDLFLPVLGDHDNYPFYIPAGSYLYNFCKSTNRFSIADLNFRCLKTPLFYPRADIREYITDAANSFVNIPYLWGGKNPFGMDCSGLTQTVMKLFGVNIPRDSSQQAKTGVIVGRAEDSKPGDLAFFETSKGVVTHTGIITGEHQIVHSSGKVRIDKIDNRGIYNEELKSYTHNLQVIKNFIDWL